MENKSFKIQFSDKSVWHEMKEDFKSQIKDLEIRYDYSEKKPEFNILYKSSSVKIKIIWVKEGGLTMELIANENLKEEEIEGLSQIFDMLMLFGGELVSGSRPEEWSL
ncbi:MAG: hypothetical protein ACFFBD_08490 [Candidatus Hodarchaeota archaeon]